MAIESKLLVDETSEQQWLTFVSSDTEWTQNAKNVIAALKEMPGEFLAVTRLSMTSLPIPVDLNAWRLCRSLREMPSASTFPQSGGNARVYASC